MPTVRTEPFGVDDTPPPATWDAEPGQTLRAVGHRIALVAVLVFLTLTAGVVVTCVVLGGGEAAWAVPCAILVFITVMTIVLWADSQTRRTVSLLRTGFGAMMSYRAVDNREHKAKKRWQKPKDEWLSIYRPEYHNVPKEVEDAVDADWKEVHHHNADRLRDTAMKEKGLWMKLCQYLASRADLLPPIYIQLLKVFEDSQPERPFAETMHTIRAEIGSGALTDIQQPPLSVASIGSVYRAKLADTGEDVVVKVLHRDIVEQLQLDCDIILFLLTILARARPVWDFRPLMQEWLREAPQEVDFRREVRNMTDARAAMESVAHLPEPFGFRFAMPTVVRRYTRRRVLVLGFAKGARLREFVRRPPPGANFKRLVRDIVRGTMTQILVHGVFNADPHPGNFLVMDDGTPVFLDFGLCKRFNADFRVNLAKTLVLADEFDQPGIEAAFKKLGLVLKDPMLNMWLCHAVRLHWDCRSVKEKRAQMHKEVAQAASPQQRAKQRESQLKLQSDGIFQEFPESYVLYQRATELLRGVAMLLGFQGSLLPTVLPFARCAVVGQHPSDPAAVDREQKCQERGTMQTELSELISKTKKLLLGMYNVNSASLLSMVKHHAASPDAVSAEAVDVSVERITVDIKTTAGARRTVYMRMPSRVSSVPELESSVRAMLAEAGCDVEVGPEQKMAIMKLCFEHPDEFRELEQARFRYEQARAAASQPEPVSQESARADAAIACDT